MPELAGRVADAFESLVREHEERWLSPLAVRSYESRGRAHAEDECRLRTPFQRDRDRIVHSKAFRRLRCIRRKHHAQHRTGQNELIPVLLKTVAFGPLQFVRREHFL